MTGIEAVEKLKFLLPGKGTIDLTHGQACARLAAEWKDEPYPRLAESPLDVDAGTANPYWELVRLMRRDPDPYPWMSPWAVYQDYKVFGPIRKALTKAYAWSIPSPADLLWLRDVLNGQGVVEIGAGSGYWAWQLRQLGVDIVAYDSWDWEWDRLWTDVAEGNTRQVMDHADRALMLIWPPYSSPMASTALDFYQGDLLIYAGEGEGGCTADDTFHEMLEASWTEVAVAPHHPTFDGIHCQLSAFRRAVPS